MFRSTSDRTTATVQARPALEALEDRCLLSATVLQTNLVSDLPGVAPVTDPQLVNPWGIAESAGSPFWISDNNAGVSTLYNTQGAKQKLVVGIPTPIDPTGATGTPTGIVSTAAAAAGAFLLANGKPASFIFATEDGTIVAWNGGLGAEATIVVNNSGNNFMNPNPSKETGAVYKGLALGTDASGTTSLLYAANFRTGQIDVFDSKFQPVTLQAGAFSDPNLPGDYAPFNVQVLGSKVYVTYAKQDADKHDDVGGHNHGFIDVFNLDGSPGLANGTARLVTRDHLDSPWGLAIAPPTFGSLGGALLVGNFESGFIDAFNPTTGAFLGQLTDPDGEPIQINGLWALQVGNGGNGGDSGTLYFTAGLFGETHGLFGSLAPVAPGTPEGSAEQQMVTAFQDEFNLAVQTLNTDLSIGASKTQLRQDLQAVETSLVNLLLADLRFAADSRANQLGTGSGSAYLSTPHILDSLFAELGDL